MLRQGLGWVFRWEEEEEEEEDGRATRWVAAEGGRRLASIGLVCIDLFPILFASFGLFISVPVSTVVRLIPCSLTTQLSIRFSLVSFSSARAYLSTLASSLVRRLNRSDGRLSLPMILREEWEFGIRTALLN